MYGKMNKMNTMKKGGRKRVTKEVSSTTGVKTKMKYNKDGSLKKMVSRDSSGKLNRKVKFNKDGTAKKAIGVNVPGMKKKKKMGGKKMYREGGANNASYSYQDFLDL